MRNTTNGARRCVLLIEDEEFIRLTVSDHLKDAGHVVEEADCGSEGLRLFDPARHDAVLLDLRLGDMDGHTILTRLRHKSPEIPVIIVSGAGDMHDVIKALRTGASDFLTKPILDFALLDHALHKAWEGLDLRRERAVHAQELERRVLERTAELAETNRKLRESEALFRQLVDNIQEIFWLHQIDPPKTIYLSKACEDILGLPLEVLAEDMEHLISRAHPDDRTRMREWVRNPPLEAAVQETFRFIRPDGEQLWLRTKIFPIADATGPVTRIAGITEDITEYVAAAERAKEDQRRLIQADKLISLGTLAAGVAHEINNPNHLLRLNAQALQRIWEMAAPPVSEAPAALTTEIPNLLRGILGASDRIRDIVRHMKDFARPEAVDTDGPVDLEAVLNDTLALLHNRLKNATDHLDVRIEGGLPRVKGSHQRLEQVLVNLVMNAAEALNGKDRALRISLHRKGPRHVEVTVIDQGPGISPEAMAHLCDPFFTTKRDHGGLGLGLAISRTIVDAHGGELGFESPPEGGTLARVVLPAMETDS